MDRKQWKAIVDEAIDRYLELAPQITERGVSDVSSAIVTHVLGFARVLSDVGRERLS